MFIICPGVRSRWMRARLGAEQVAFLFTDQNRPRRKIYCFRFQNYPLLLRIVKEGGHRGLTECQQQFKNEIWNCSLENKNAFYKQLPIFVMTTLSYGKFELFFMAY